MFADVKEPQLYPIFNVQIKLVSPYQEIKYVIFIRTALTAVMKQLVLSAALKELMELGSRVVGMIPVPDSISGY